MIKSIKILNETISHNYSEFKSNKIIKKEKDKNDVLKLSQKEDKMLKNCKTYNNYIRIKNIEFRGIKQIGCFTHIIQIIINKSINNNKTIKCLIDKILKFYLNNKKIIKNFKFNIQIPNITRWNSLYLFLNNLYKNKIFNKIDENFLTSLENLIFKNLLSIMKKFYEITLFLEQKMLYPGFFYLKRINLIKSLNNVINLSNINNNIKIFFIFNSQLLKSKIFENKYFSKEEIDLMIFLIPQNHNDLDIIFDINLIENIIRLNLQRISTLEEININLNDKILKNRNENKKDSYFTNEEQIENVTNDIDLLLIIIKISMIKMQKMS